MKSQPITISRYSNGTLVKLNVTDSAFVSYDYNPETDAATYIPNTITITPTFSGGVKFGKWRYSTNGANFYDVVSGQHGFTTSGNTLILNATSDLYKTTNSAVIVACYGDNPLYYDTVTIMRYVDPTFVYKKTSTAIKQTNDKISLIATEEQFAKYGSKFTVLDDLQAQIDVIPSKISLAVKEEHGIITGEMNTALSEYATLEEMESQLELTSQSITSSVSKTYQTKSDSVAALNEAKEYTDNAEQDANDYTDGKVQNVAADLRSEIKQSADNITSTVSATYQTQKAAASDLSAAKAYADEVASDATAIANGKTTAYYQTSAPTGAREGDLWIDTDDGNSLHRYNGSNWITIDNTKIQKALTDAADAQSTADKKIITFAQTSQPTATGVGDLWIDTDDDNKLYRWNGSAWTAYRDGAIAKAESSAKSYADKKDAALETQLESKITQTAQDITSTVSTTYQTIADAEDDLDEAKSYADDKATQLESKITQTANSITSTVSQNYQSKTDAASDLNNAKTYADNKNAALKTEIKQTTDSISSTVSKKVGKDEIISSINQSAESIKINANKVNITGFVTFDNLKNSGETTINGSNITTGSISASLIKGGKLILRPGSTYTTAIEVQNSSGTKLIAIDGNGMTGYSGGAAPTFKLLGNEISFYRSSTVLTQIKDGDIYTAGKLYFTSGNSWAGTHIIEIGQTLSGAVLNVISGKTTLKATEIFASSGKALLITGNSSSYALHVTLGETVLQKLTAGATSVSSLSASGAATIAGATTINNTLTVSADSNGSDAIKVSTGRINAPVYYGAIYATSSNLGFFGGSTNATKQSVSKLSLYATLANVITKVNDLLTALAKYNLITSY